ncbi:hypothetical protein ABFS82_09G007400 [Erythranthe guttata]
MAKRWRSSCSEKDNKGLDKHSSIDRIGALPDDLLVNILSLLTFKEAIATSVLSSRWRYLWTFVPKLDFDGGESLLKVSSKGCTKSLLNKERSAYVEWVDHVLALHNNSTVEEFRVFFDLDKSYKDSIGKWIRYALARKIQRLELNLTDEFYGRRGYDKYYDFPYKLLKRVENPIAIDCLKSICMNCVNVSGEALEFFLCNCPLLENLSVSESGQLSSLRIISGSSRSLKSLEISLCHNLELVEIRDSNLVCFKYEGPRINFLLENVPHLVEMFIGGIITKHMEDVVSLISSHQTRLEILTIDFLKNQVYWEETEMFRSAVKMRNLKKFVVKVDAYKDCSLLPLTNLIRSSPCLRRFVLETNWWAPEVVERKVEKVTKSKYVHLKEMEFVGYNGRISDLEMIMHFLENSVLLEKIVVDTRNVIRPALLFKEEVEAKEKYLRTRVVKQLRNKVAPPVNLTIL